MRAVRLSTGVCEQQSTPDLQTSAWEPLGRHGFSLLGCVWGEENPRLRAACSTVALPRNCHFSVRMPGVFVRVCWVTTGNTSRKMSPKSLQNSGLIHTFLVSLNLSPLNMARMTSAMGGSW